jgi:hypothetical protein
MYDINTLHKGDNDDDDDDDDTVCSVSYRPNCLFKIYCCSILHQGSEGTQK